MPLLSTCYFCQIAFHQIPIEQTVRPSDLTSKKFNDYYNLQDIHNEQHLSALESWVHNSAAQAKHTSERLSSFYKLLAAQFKLKLTTLEYIREHNLQDIPTSSLKRGFKETAISFLPPQ